MIFFGKALFVFRVYCFFTDILVVALLVMWALHVCPLLVFPLLWWAGGTPCWGGCVGAAVAWA